MPTPGYSSFYSSVSGSESSLSLSKTLYNVDKRGSTGLSCRNLARTDGKVMLDTECSVEDLLCSRYKTEVEEHIEIENWGIE